MRKASYGLSIGASPASTSPTSQKKSSDSDGSGLVVLLLLSSKRLSWNFEDFILGGGPPECYFGRWPPAYYSRTPLPTVKKEQEILRAKFANPERNGDNDLAIAWNTVSLRGCFFTSRALGWEWGASIFSVCGDLGVAAPKTNATSLQVLGFVAFMCVLFGLWYFSL